MESLPPPPESCCTSNIKLSTQNSIKWILVKYGGSAITFKNEFERLNDGMLSSISKQLYEIKQRNSLLQHVIVHGAGSFGHFHAKEYNLKHGGLVRESDNTNEVNSNASQSPSAFDSVKYWQRGLVLTRQSVQKLNSLVVNEHIANNLDAVGISLFPTTTASALTENGSTPPIEDINKQNYFNHTNQHHVLHTIPTLLKHGLLPVIHGDVVFDENNQRCTIFGGDKIILWLCRHIDQVISHSSPCSSDSFERATDLSAQVRVVFLTDVAGVYDRPPSTAGATLISTILVNSDGTTDLVAQTETAAHDVTGGISAKLQTAVEIARMGIEVCIVQVGSESAELAMSGQPPKMGTVIWLKEKDGSIH